MRKGKMTKIGMMLFIFMLSTSCGNVPEQLQTEQETVLSTEASLDEKEISKIKEWGKILYEYSSKEDSAIYSKGNSAVCNSESMGTICKILFVGGGNRRKCKKSRYKRSRRV